MTDRSKRSRNQAEVAFRKTQKAERDKDKSQAMLQYESDIDATRKKSARLRELRLAKEAADAAAAQPAGAKKRKKK